MANLKKSLKRGMAALLAVCLVLTSFNGVAWASETPGGVGPDEDVPAKFVLKYDANEFIEAAQEAIASGEIYAADEMEFAKSDYNKLFNDSESTVFEFYPEERVDEDEEEVSSPEEDIAALSDVLGADVRMFIRVNGWDAEAEEEYVMTGEEEIIFLFINALEEKLTFQIDINGFITKEITVPGNTSSLGGFGSATGSNADTKAPGNKVDTNVPGKNDGTTAPAVPETTPAEQPATEATESTPAEQPTTEAVETTPAETTEAVTDPTETLPVESSEAESVEETTAAADVTEPAESADSTEASTEAEAESSTAASEEAATEAVVETEETTEAQSEAATEAATEEPATVEEATEAEPEAPAAEEPATEAEPVITMSRNDVPVVGSAPEVGDDEDVEEEPAEEPAEKVTGDLTGKTLGASQIVEEEVTSKAFVTSAKQIMGLMKAAAKDYELIVTHVLKVNEKSTFSPSGFLYVFKETDATQSITFEDGKTEYDYATAFKKNIDGISISSESKTKVTEKDLINGKNKVEILYTLDSGSYIKPWIADAYFDKDYTKYEKVGYFPFFPEITNHGGRYPKYITAEEYGSSFDAPSPHHPDFAKGVCQSTDWLGDTYKNSPLNEHYVILGSKAQDAISYIRCDGFAGEDEEKVYYAVHFVYVDDNNIDRNIDSISVKEKSTITKTHSDYVIPDKIEDNGKRIVGWIDRTDDKVYTIDGVDGSNILDIYHIVVSEPRIFEAILEDEPIVTHTVTFKAGEHGTLNNGDSMVVFPDIISGTKWGDTSIVEPTVTETPNSNYRFVRWEPVLPNDDFVITENLTYVAQYEEIPNGQLVVKKQVAGTVDSGEAEFAFKVEFKDANKDLSYEGGRDVKPTSEGGTTTYDFKLANGEQIEFSNISKTVSFTVTELKYENSEYGSECTDIKLLTSDENHNVDVQHATVTGNLSGITSNQITFVNDYELKQGVIVHKTISGENNPDTNEAYYFQVEKLVSDKWVPYNDFTSANKTDNGLFKIVGESYAALSFTGDLASAKFRIVEVDMGTATSAQWSNSSEPSFTSAEFMVDKKVVNFTCNNEYNNQILNLKKEVSGIETAPEGSKYVFGVELKDKDNNPVTSISYEAKGLVSINGVTMEGSGIVKSEKGVYVVTLTADKDGQIGSIAFSNIPVMAQYKVYENKYVDGVYDVKLDKIIVNENEYGELSGEVKSNSVSGAYGAEVNQIDVTFVNKFTPIRADIQMKKVLEEEAAEDVTFLFRIENKDEKSLGYGEVFYTSLTVKAGMKESKVETLNELYASKNYTISELDNMRYELVGEIETVDTTLASKVITVTNRKVSSGYFSDSSMIVNEVKANDDGNWEFVPDMSGNKSHEDLPKATNNMVALIPNNKTDNFAEHGFDDGDVPLARC